MSQRRKNRSRAGDSPSAHQPPWFLPVVLVLVGATLVIIVLLLTRPGQTGLPANFTPQTNGAPRVEVAEDFLDYGSVQFESPVEAVFRVRNVGDQPLQVLGEPQVELIEGC